MHGGAHDLIGHAAAEAAQLGQLAKICQKLHQKNWEIEQTDCISWTNFDYEAHSFTGNENVESCFRKFVKSHQTNGNYFWQFIAT